MSAYRERSTKACEEYSIEAGQKCTSTVAMASQLADAPVLEHNRKLSWLVTWPITLWQCGCSRRGTALWCEEDSMDLPTSPETELIDPDEAEILASFRLSLLKTTCPATMENLWKRPAIVSR